MKLGTAGTCEERLSLVCGSVEQEALEEVSSTEAGTKRRKRAEHPSIILPQQFVL